MKSKLLKFIGVLAILIVLALAGYLSLLRYYQNKIPYGTWINDVYCTGKTYSEAAELLLLESEYIPEVLVVDVYGNSYKFVLPKDAYELSYREGLEDIIKDKILFSKKDIELKPTVTVDIEKFTQELSAQIVFDEQAVLFGDKRLQIVKKQDGFHLVDTFEHVIDVEKTKTVIYEAFIHHEQIVLLAEKGCYFTPEYTAEDNVILVQYQKLQDFCDTFTMNLTIEGKTVYRVDASVIKDWLKLHKDGTYITTKNGAYQLDKTKVKEYAQAVSKEVSTYFGKPWRFKNHNGETIEVKAGNYGRALQINKLYNVLLNAFEQGNESTYELEFVFYPKSAKDVAHGAGIGTSYIEVDISGQEIFLYLDGEEVFTSDCVTGDVRRHYDTPKGVFYVEYKQRNRILKGEDYRTPVNYWMHFYNHCGFHDAAWRRAFGESIYLKDGSHGCINMPYDKAKELYELVYKGIPVVVY